MGNILLHILENLSFLVGPGTSAAAVLVILSNLSWEVEEAVSEILPSRAISLQNPCAAITLWIGMKNVIVALQK